MTNVAIFGGSFDPPHLGHVMVVSHLLLNEPDIDQVLIVPCYQQSGKELTDFQHRYRMCKASFCFLNRVNVSHIEGILGGESLTYRTIQTLKDRHPDWNLRFVIGSDLRDSIKTWEGGDIIERLAPPIVVGRAGIPQEDGPTPICPVISSTIVRSALSAGRYHEAERYLVAPALGYIRQFKLYTPDSLKPGWTEHPKLNALYQACGTPEHKWVGSGVAFCSVCDEPYWNDEFNEPNEDGPCLGPRSNLRDKVLKALLEDE